MDSVYGYVRQPGVYDPDEASLETAISEWSPSLAIQSEKEDADINTIVRRFGITGTIPEGLVPPTYGDFTGIDDFQTAMNAVNAARDLFMQVPADIRAKFDNDPQNFVAFCSDPANLEEMRKMGLAVPEKVVETPAPMLVKVVSDEAPKVPAEE